MTDLIDGLCREYEEDIWFGRATSRQAKRVCAICPVREECLELALTSEEPGVRMRYGIFGGLAPSEREELWRLRACSGK